MLTLLFSLGLPLFGIAVAIIAGLYVPSPLKRLVIEGMLLLAVASALYGKGRADADRVCRLDAAAAEARVRLKMQGDIDLLRRSIDEMMAQKRASDEELDSTRVEIHRAPPAADAPAPSVILKAIRGK